MEYLLLKFLQKLYDISDILKIDYVQTSAESDLWPPQLTH